MRIRSSHATAANQDARNICDLIKSSLARWMWHPRKGIFVGQEAGSTWRDCYPLFGRGQVNIDFRQRGRRSDGNPWATTNTFPLEWASSVAEWLSYEIASKGESFKREDSGLWRRKTLYFLAMNKWCTRRSPPEQQAANECGDHQIFRRLYGQRKFRRASEQVVLKGFCLTEWWWLKYAHNAGC